MATITTFEELPDEMILNVCGYLRGTDVLYSFFNLNARLNATIRGYCQYVNLLVSGYLPLHHVVSRVLPRIGPFVRSFVLNGCWKVVLSANASALLFSSQLSVRLPHLQTLTIKWFTGEDMSLLLPNLKNLSELVALDIRLLHGDNDDGLRTRILGANNSQLKYVSFDEGCVSLSVPDNGGLVSYSNIEELTVNINGNQSLQYLFTVLSNVRRLHVRINDRDTDDTELSEALATLLPLVHLIDFQLQGHLTSWTFDEIVDLLRLMPSLQKLTLSLTTEDERFIHAENLIQILPSSVTQIHLAIRYLFPGVDFKTDDLYALWPQSLPINCLLDVAEQNVLFFTIPYSLRSIELSAELREQMSSGSGWN